VIAALTAALSFVIPLANDVTEVARGESVLEPQDRAETFSGSWRGTRAMTSLASARGSTPSSMAATVTVSDFQSESRLTVVSRAMVLAGGIRSRFSLLAFSGRRRVAHLLTTRSEPRNP